MVITKATRGCNVKENPVHLAAAFACAVTVPTSNHMDWVARNGDESLFHAFNLVLPEVAILLELFTPLYNHCIIVIVHRLSNDCVELWNGIQVKQVMFNL